MKKLMTMVCAMIMAVAANASKVTTVAFNEARISVPARVRFVSGDHYGFSVEVKDSAIAKAIRCSVKDGILRIGYGQGLKPGTSKYDAKKDVYYYGVNAKDQVLPEFYDRDEMVITVVSPELPVVKTSSDYIAISERQVENAKKVRTDLTMNE